MTNKVDLGQLPTGVPGLDTLLGGGLPEFSFNVIAGAPGSCKTTLAHQIMFAMANPQRKALFFTVVGEPPLKMLRYQQQYSFFDIDKVGFAIRYVNLADDLHSGGFEGVLSRILTEVADFQPGLIFVDSFKSVAHTARPGNEGIADLQHFVQKLGIQMASWQATTFLIGEYAHAETDANPIFTVADGLISLSQHLHDNYVVRKIRVVKIRGQAHLAGLHTFRISNDGVHIFPRLLEEDPGDDLHQLQGGTAAERLPTGVPGLDDMLGGGLPAGYSVLVAGPSGSGKTVLATSFLAEGARQGENGIIASLERSILRSANKSLTDLIVSGRVAVIGNQALGLSIEEMLDNLIEVIGKTGAKRIVIDSLTTLELALAPEFRKNFRESMYRMIASLKARGVTVLITTEPDERFGDFEFVSSGKAFLTDAVIALRYFESKGRMKRMIAVPKVRGSAHSNELRQYEITGDGIVIGEALSHHDNLLSGHATERPRPTERQ